MVIEGESQLQLQSNTCKLKMQMFECLLNKSETNILYSRLLSK